MRTTHRSLLVLALALASACGGGAVTGTTAPPTTPATAVTTTAAAAASSTPPPSASAAPAYAAVGSASATVSQSKVVATSATVHVGFIGDEPLAPGTYAEQLNLVTLQPGGRTVAHKHGGVEWVYVIEGSIEVRMGNGTRATLTTGQNAKVPAGTPVQAVNTGAAVAKFLAFFVTADGQPFQTNLETAP